ncbi:MAG: hypothetical protein J6X79_07190 [Bacteroidales bacterium]|nr:hypothetical protein [Bacteroidales bacterium]
MNIISWSKLIYRYYFEKNVGDRVILHISMQDLIDYAKDENAEIANGRLANTFSDDFIRDDFVRKFWISSDGNNSLKDLQIKINQIKEQAQKEDNCVILLSIVAVLIMPICENDDLELHGNDYYGHLRPFLYSNRFINKEPTTVSNLLAAIKLDEIWVLINNWATINNLPFRPRIVISENGTKQYARSLMKESLLAPSKLQKFCFLFDRAGLVPKVNIEDDRLLSSFTNYYMHIGIQQPKFKLLTNKEFLDYLLAELRGEYDNWDGTTRINERDRSTGRIRVESGNTCYPLLLQMDYDLHSNNCTFAFQLYCSDMDNMDYMAFVVDSNNKHLPQVYIRNDGYAHQPFVLTDNELGFIFANRQGSYCIHEENDKSLSGRHVVTDYYILRQYKNKYIATNEFVKGEFYFAIIRHDAANDFNEWLTANEAVLITDGALGGFYSVYRIERAQEELSNRNNLRFKTEIRCKSINNIEVKTEEDTDTVFLSELLPVQFEITGIDVSKDRVFAVSVNSTHRYSSELEYDRQKKLWILKVFSDYFQRKSEFQLYCNETPIPYGRIYKFKEFTLPTKFKELQLDQWGSIGNSTLSKGLELSCDFVKKNLINWTTLNMQMQNARPCTINSGKYLKKDYLLYAITSASYETSRWIITMPWLKEIRDRLSGEFENKDIYHQINRYSLANALADYFRMGYINYAYTDAGFCVTANRPTLILLTPKYKRTVSKGLRGRNMVTVSCEENEYKCLLTGGRSIALIERIERYQRPLDFHIEYVENTDFLQPQTIYIHASKRSAFSALAEKCNLLYQDTVYANALLAALPSIDNYIADKTINGTERNLFGVNSFRAIDYKKMAALYPEKMATKQAIANYEIDKDAFDRQNDVVTFFPGTRDETTIMIDKGRMVEIDKYWGYFVGMYKSQAKVIQYDEDNIQISLPQQFRLPLLYARALTLLTGSTPNSVFGSRTYSLDVNPLAGEIRPARILQKLGQ